MNSTPEIDGFFKKIAFFEKNYKNRQRTFLFQF